MDDLDDQRNLLVQGGLLLSERLSAYFNERGEQLSADERLLRGTRLEGLLRLLQQVDPANRQLLSVLGEFFHKQGNLRAAGPFYEELLRLDPPRQPDKETAERIRRFAPVLYVHRSEPFPLRDCVAIAHPERPIITYRLFWEDDWDFPDDYAPCDHEVIWVEYDPGSGRLTRVCTYFHGILLSTEEAVAEANEHGGRPQVRVQWGKHGSMLTGAEKKRYAWKSESALPGIDIMRIMYEETRRGGRLADHPIKKGWAPPFEGSFDSYLTFDQAIDTREYIGRHNRQHATPWVNALLVQQVLTYYYTPKNEWPEPLV